MEPPKPLKKSEELHQITEHKRLEDVLMLMKFAVENAAINIFWLNSTGRCIYANKQAAGSLGYTQVEMRKLAVWDIDPLMTRDLWPEHWQELKSKKLLEFEMIHQRRDGSRFPVMIHSNYIRQGEEEFVFSFVHDISDRKRAEEERQANLHLLESLERIDHSIRNEKDIDRMLNNVLKIVFSIFESDRVWLLYPCDPDASSFKVPFEITRPEYPGAKALGGDLPMHPSHAQELRDALEFGGPVLFGPDTDRPLASGHYERFGVRSQMMVAVYPMIGKPWVFGLHQCSHSRKWTKHEQHLFKEISNRIADSLNSRLFLRDLQESEEKLRATFEQAAVGISHLDLDGRWLKVNQKLCDIVGYTKEEMLRMSYTDITHPADLEMEDDLHRRMIDGMISMFSREKRYIHKNGSIVWINLTVSVVRHASYEPAYVISVVEDITTRKKAERDKEKLKEQLLQAQKMESVGRLAGGVAHDFNNMLSVILGHTELALGKLDQEDPLRRELEAIQEAGQRSADFTQQLLAFARQEPISPQVLDLNRDLTTMFSILQRLMGVEIELVWVPGHDLWPVRVDPSQLNQVLANLCINARDAIGGVGRVTIETANASLSEKDYPDRIECVPGEYVLLAVSDNGPGMDKEILQHIFEPFFTTKREGEGTGLGLSTVYGIVRQNEGFIAVQSEPGQGTTIKIYLPRYSGGVRPAKEERDAGSAVRSHETVLLVEDEPAILKMSTRMLQKLGFKVLTADRPSKAIDLAGEHADKIDLLLTDMVMPEMNGWDLATQIKKRYPKIKQLFMSGYSADIIDHHRIFHEGVCFIQKPFSQDELDFKIREALGKSRRYFEGP